METIPQKELRNNVGEVLRRAEQGAQFTITVSGRPVARLGPVGRKRWVAGNELARIWHTPAPQEMEADLESMPATVADPFE